MGFFSPGFIIGAASSLTNQIEDAKERNAKMMERRRDQFDQLSREAKRELNRKKMTEQEYVDLAKEVLSPDLKIQIGDDPALLAAAGRSFKTQSQVRRLTPSNFNKSLLLSGTTKEGKFDPTKAFNITEPPKMDVETQTEEGFFGRAFRGITGAPSQQELAETDPSRLTTDIREASVNLDRIYNPLPADSREWDKYERLFAESSGLKAVVDPLNRTIDRTQTFAQAKTEVRQKLNILNELRIGQAYTEDDLPSILTDINTIYGMIKDLPADQSDAVISKIASDMNRTSVPDVMSKLGEYVPKKDDSKTGAAQTKTPNTTDMVSQPSPDTVPDQPDAAVNQPLPPNLMAKLQSQLKNSDWVRNNSYTDEKTGKIIIEFEDDGKVYLISNDEETSRPIILSVTPVSEQQ
jgi:hypothetical protein